MTIAYFYPVSMGPAPRGHYQGAYIGTNLAGISAVGGGIYNSGDPYAPAPNPSQGVFLGDGSGFNVAAGEAYYTGNPGRDDEFAFNITGLPAGATINSVNVEMHILSNNGDDAIFLGDADTGVGAKANFGQIPLANGVQSAALTYAQVTSPGFAVTIFNTDNSDNQPPGSGGWGNAFRAEYLRVVIDYTAGNPNLDLTVTPVGTVKVGEAARFDCTITNSGSFAGTGTFFGGPYGNRWTWTATGTAGTSGYTSNTLQTTAAISDAVTIPPGGSVTYQILMNTGPNALAGDLRGCTVSLARPASNTTGPGTNQTVSQSMPIDNPIRLAVSNISNTVKPGGTVTVVYKVQNVAADTGDGHAAGVAVRIELPTGIPGITAAWTAADTAVGTTGGAPSGSGAVIEDLATMMAQSERTYTVVYTVPANASCSGSFTPFIRANVNS